MTRRMVPQCQDFLDALKPLSRACDRGGIARSCRETFVRGLRGQSQGPKVGSTPKPLSDAIPAVAEDQRQSDLVLAAI